MAVQAIVSSSTGSGIRIALGETDDLFVAQGVTIASTNDVVVTATGSYQRADILGSVVGGVRAITMGNDPSNDRGQYLFVGKTGYLSGYSDGSYLVRIDAYDSTIENRGTIFASKGLAVWIGGNHADAASTIINSGTIEAKGSAIAHVGTDTLNVMNTGTIIGSYEGNSGKDTILNTGKMTGNVMLNDGNDVFDTRSGTFSGQLDAGAGADKLYGSSKADTFDGGADNDKIYGYAGSDKLTGGDGDDYISGGDGNDKISGGLGKDKLLGGAGADTFIFKALAESTVAAAGRDLILDFSQSQKDRIDLSSIDAKASTPTDNSFTFIGKAAFHQKEGELRYKISGGDTLIYGDVNGDGTSDFKIVLDGSFTLKATDFIL